MARAGGNPFFGEEIVRDLAERGVISGERGAYICLADGGEASVPATFKQPSPRELTVSTRAPNARCRDGGHRDAVR